MISLLGLDTVVKERMSDPQTRKLFSTLLWMVEDREPADQLIDKLMEDIPSDKKELGRTLIKNTLNSLK